jgi:hypothetical protein
MVRRSPADVEGCGAGILGGGDRRLPIRHCKNTKQLTIKKQNSTIKQHVFHYKNRQVITKKASTFRRP